MKKPRLDVTDEFALASFRAQFLEEIEAILRRPDLKTALREDVILVDGWPRTAAYALDTAMWRLRAIDDKDPAIVAPILNALEAISQNPRASREGPDWGVYNDSVDRGAKLAFEIMVDMGKNTSAGSPLDKALAERFEIFFDRQNDQDKKNCSNPAWPLETEDPENPGTLFNAAVCDCFRRKGLRPETGETPGLNPS
jgi:hypothetical protein